MVREVVAAVFFYKRRILAVSFSILFLIGTLALTMKKQYEAAASLIVLLGTEYTYRPSAGEQATANAVLEREQILRTEVEILGNANLHREVLRKIGLERAYPDLLKPPGSLARLRAAVTSVLDRMIVDSGVRRTEEENAGEQADQTLELALASFNSQLSLQVAKTGSTIGLGFTNPDPQVAADILNTLAAMYLDLRRKLFGSTQSSVVSEQVQQLRQQLEQTDRRLTEFKARNNIANFQTRREIVLREQGDLEKEKKEAESLLDQNAARIAALEGQLAKLPPEIQSSRSTEVDARATPLRTSLEQLLAKRSELLTQYRADSAAVRSVNEQIAARQAELASSRGDRSTSGFIFAQNPLWANISSDLFRAQGELRAAEARLAQATVHTAEVANHLRDLNRLEEKLQDLERARQIADDSFRSASKVFEDRRLIESVEAQKQASVRLLQPALVPTMPKGTRRLILLAGIALSLVGAAITALLSNYFRPYYLLAESLERDAGIAVLATVAERNQKELERMRVI